MEPCEAVNARNGASNPIASLRHEEHEVQVDMKPDLVGPAERWVRIDAYLEGLRRRVSRRSHRIAARTEPEAPRLMLSTVPFAVLIAVLGLLIVAFAVAAFPPSQPRFEPPEAKKELGTAPPGWFDEAKKEFR